MSRPLWTSGAWTPDDDARLRALWDEGLSAAQIGAAMGRSKNSVLGRAHRQKLPARPNPVGNYVAKPRTSQRPRYDDRPAKRDRERAASVAIAIAAPSVSIPLFAMTPGPRDVPPPVAPGGATCRYPLWGRERPTHRYCDASAPLGEPYCPGHRARCWVPFQRAEVVA